jgi:hypothetical protein
MTIAGGWVRVTFQPPLAEVVRDGLISAFRLYGYTVVEADEQVSCEVTIRSIAAPESVFLYTFDFRNLVKQADSVLIQKNFVTVKTAQEPSPVNSGFMKKAQRPSTTDNSARLRGYFDKTLSSAIEDLVEDLDIATALRTAQGGKAYAAQPPPPAPSIPAATVSLPSGVACADDSSVAVVIGIADYVFLGKIPGCKADAAAFANAFCGARRMNPKNVVLMTDDGDTSHQPTTTMIKERVELSANEVKSEGMFLVYFSGHAVTQDGKALLVPKDARPADGIPVRQVVALMKESKARDKVLIIDACHAGAAEKGILVVARESLPEAAGVAMFLSCSSDENSYPTEDGQRSVYTDVFLRCLQEACAGQSAITARALEGKIDEKMREWRLRTAMQQTPQLILAGETDVTLVPAGPSR